MSGIKVGDKVRIDSAIPGASKYLRDFIGVTGKVTKIRDGEVYIEPDVDRPDFKGTPDARHPFWWYTKHVTVEPQFKAGSVVKIVGSPWPKWEGQRAEYEAPSNLGHPYINVRGLTGNIKGIAGTIDVKYLRVVEHEPSTFSVESTIKALKLLGLDAEIAEVRKLAEFLDSK